MKKRILISALACLFCLIMAGQLFPQDKELKEKINQAYTAMLMRDYQNGIAYIQRGQYYAAINSFNSMLKMDPQNTLAFFNRGYCRAQLKSYQGALSDFNSAIYYNPRYGEAYRSRGLVKLLLGNAGAGCADFRKADWLGVDCSDVIGLYCH